MSRSLHAQTLAAAQAAFHAGDFETTLRQTAVLLDQFLPMDSYLPMGGGMPQVDFLLEALGGKLREELDATANPATGQDWILATIVYEHGGHTPVIADLAAALPQQPAGLVLTMAGQDAASLTAAALKRTGFAPESIHRIGGATFLETCRKVLRHFRSAPPRRLFLLHHPSDPTAVVAAAALAGRGTEIWLVHHADFCPSMGLFLQGVRLLELTPRTCAFTRHVLGLDPIWLPLTCPDPEPAPRHWLRRGHLTTAFSGSVFKSDKANAYSYPEILTAVLRATGGMHVHWGSLHNAQREEIAGALDKAGIAPERFVYIPSVPTLAEGLRAEGVDLLLNSWPLGGARTSVEAMAAGIPVVWHSAHPSHDRIRLQMSYEGAEVWRQPADFINIVSKADASWLQAQSVAARKHYEDRHHPQHWRNFFAQPDSANGFPLPKGFDASMFLPAWWDHALDQFDPIDDPRFDALQAQAHQQGLEVQRHEQVIVEMTEIYAQQFAVLQEQLGAMKRRVQKQEQELRRSKEKLQHLSHLKTQLSDLEQKAGETRYPWPMRMLRRWWKGK
jgi:hypothetical protein